MKPVRQVVDGVLLLNKPVGITSNAALQKAKWLLNALKAGHTGTLDPFADGLLPLCFGEATKFSAYLLDADKQYRAVLQLGVTTTTGDPEGDVLSAREVNTNESDLLAVLPRFSGEIEQVPPMHSALKHQGRPLYEYARAGIEIDRPPRKVTIRSLRLIEYAAPRVVLDVQCSSGTYIRTLAQDIGAVLGCGAHLTALTRLASGGFQLADAVSLAALETFPSETRISQLRAADCLLMHLPALQLNAAQAHDLMQGRVVMIAETPDSGLVRVYTETHDFIGLAEACAQTLTPRRLRNTQANIAVPDTLPQH